MAIGSSDDRLMSEINVTPFVDVMLVLLIIFMVTAPMMTQGVDVVLPEATSGPLQAKEDQIIVTISKEGRIFVNEYPVDLQELKDKLIKIFENNKNRTVYIKADKDITYGTVVYAMAQIKEAGIQNVGMVTIPVQVDDVQPKKVQ